MLHSAVLYNAVLHITVLCCAVTAANWPQEEGSSADKVSRKGGKSRLRPTSSGQVLTDEPESGVILFQKVWCVWC